MDIKGVKNFKTCYFYEDTPDGICEYRRKNDFKGIYKLEIPNDLSLIKVRVGNETVAIDFNRFKEKLRAFYFILWKMTFHVVTRQAKRTSLKI